ncbi:Glycosyl transferase family 11 [Popillia japonica]|uniref:L-Fucosyltransferase n=1 Tax=Popillia japonica TaxID=7064 RepID=A0AAW1LR34_POPJA
MHIFFFPLYDFHTKQTFLKTYNDFEQEICIGNIKHKNRKALRRYRRCPQYGIVTIEQGGRLGNQMWEYANVWAIARRTGLEPYIPACIRLKLDLVFESLTVPTFDEIGHCPFSINKFVKSLDAWNYTNQSILLPKYSIFSEIVLTWVQDIIQEFTIKERYLQKSEQILLQASKGISNCTFVGVHIRRTDYIRYLLRKYKVQPADAEFYMNSMKYYERKYKNLVFVIVSDDPLWCQKKFGHMHNVFVVGKKVPNSAALDLAILASCNHTIFDYGTYGTWSAILAGGETIYFNITNHASVRVGQLLPNWHAMS